MMHDRAPRIVEAVADMARQAVGALALTVAFMGAAAPASAEGARAKDHTLQGEHLVPPGDLPGHDIGISAKAAELLAGASVEVEKTPIDPGDSLLAPQELCSGVTVSTGEAIDVSLAAHCFSAVTGVNTGVLNPADFPPSDGALDFFDRAFYTYTIEDPSIPPLDQYTLATANGITISTDSVDAALLRVSPAAPVSGKDGQPLPNFQQVRPLPYLRPLNLTPGQKVAMFSTTEYSHSQPVKDTGTYIGEYYEPTGYTVNGVATTRATDIVLIRPRRPYEDACYFGASGSSFVARETHNDSTTGLGGKIAISGPLSQRINSRYDPYLTPTSSNSDPTTRLKQSIVKERNWRREVEVQLGVYIDPRDTICKYSVLGSNTKSALVNDFGKNMPPPFHGGGDIGTMH